MCSSTRPSRCFSRCSKHSTSHKPRACGSNERRIAMQRRMITILVFASVVGLVASVLVYRVLAYATTRGPLSGSEPIVVATANLGLADMVTDAQVKLVPWPKQSIPEGALRTIDAATGRVVRTSIVIGEPLIEAKLAPGITGRGGIMPMLVPEGRRGVTIRVDDAIDRKR